ncbi:MAG: GatB/YqeY domain-containing protein [Candidatus Wildermuthbacteria bacterium]|nr:GatB/YqeY domain-containing protein [Candidatus Wildermuthbacteria bacterium]
MRAMKIKIGQDLKDALLSRDALRTSVLRMLLAAINNKGIEKRTTISKKIPNATESELQKESVLTDEEIQQVVMAEVKKHKESIEMFQKGNRQDLVDKEAKELQILQSYLSKQLSEEEIKKLAQEAIASTGAKSAKDMGKVMAALMPKVKGRADGALVNKIVKEFLQ